MKILSKSPSEESVGKLSLLLLNFAVPEFVVVELVPPFQIDSGTLGVFSKFSDEHPCHFYRGVPLRDVCIVPRGGGTLGISGWGCAAGTLEPLTYTRASSAEFCYPILE